MLFRSAAEAAADECRRLTQEELAELSGVSVRAISDLERGRYKTAKTHTARLLATGIGLTGPARARFEKAAVTGLGRTWRAGLCRVYRTWPARCRPSIAGFTGRTAEFRDTARGHHGRHLR